LTTTFFYSKFESLSTKKYPFLSNYHLGSDDNNGNISEGILALENTYSDFGSTSFIILPFSPGKAFLNNLE
jgi:hypothetical protein